MTRRRNGSGTLEKRGRIWYTKLWVNGKKVVRSTHTADKAVALGILNEQAMGSDLSPKERLAAIVEHLREDAPRPSFDQAWENYADAPENAGQSETAQTGDLGRWRFLTRWLFGYDGGARCRVNCKAAYPGVETLADVTPEVVQSFVKYAREVSSANTVNKYVRTFKRIWKFNGMEKNPWERYRPIKSEPHLRRALDDGEVAKLIREADGEMRVLFAFGAFTGLRMSDCARVRWDDFDQDGATLTVKPTKTKHSSGLVVSIPVHPALGCVIGKRKRSGFVTPGLAELPEWALSRRVMEHFRRCGFDETEKPGNFRHAVVTVGFHSFRSTFITNMANIGAPMAMVQAIVGHMTPEMSMHYYRANAEAARSKIAALPGYGLRTGTGTGRRPRQDRARERDGGRGYSQPPRTSGAHRGRICPHSGPGEPGTP